MNPALNHRRLAADRSLRIGLVMVWGLVAVRTGLRAFGYSILALIVDALTVVGGGSATIPTRHPRGLMVELSAKALRSADWIEPHLQDAQRLFVLGAILSVLLWLARLAYIGHLRSQYDPVFSARVDRVCAKVGVHTQAICRVFTSHIRRLVRFITRLGTRHQMKPSAAPAPHRLDEDPDQVPREPVTSEQPSAPPEVDVGEGTSHHGRDMPLSDVVTGHASIPGTSEPTYAGREAATDGAPAVAPRTPKPSSFFTDF